VNLYVDRRGWLWLSTYAGVVVRNGENWRVLGKEQAWNPSDYVRTFSERRNGDILITTFLGDVFEFTQDRLVRLPTPPGKQKMGYFGCVDEIEQWWVVQDGFIGRWNGREWNQTMVTTNLPGVTSGTVAAATARSGGVWILLGQELYRYRHGVFFPRTELGTLPGGVWSLYEDSRTNVWICTYDRGLYRLSPDGTLRHWNATNALPTDNTRYAFEDREQNIWIGTSGGGLHRYKPRRLQSFGVESGLAERIVNSISPHPDGSVWIGTYGQGMFRLSGAKASSIPLTESNRPPFYIQSVLVDREERIWAGTYGSGLWVSSPTGFRKIPERDISGNNLIALFQDAGGRVWASDGSGLGVFHLGESRRYGPEQGLPVGGVHSFAEADGRLWVANSKGVYGLENDRFVELRDHGKSLATVSCLRTDRDGTLWMGTMNQGLWRRKNGALSRIDSSHGLPEVSVHGILEDDRNFFWMPSNRGLLRVHRRDLEAIADGGASRLRCQVFDQNDGLPSVQFINGRQPNCSRDAQGRLWFATIRGVAMIDPAQIQLNEVPPPVRLESIRYRAAAETNRTSAASSRTRPRGQNGQEELHTVLGPFTQPLVLPAGSRPIEIKYTALSFSAPEKVRFLSKLEGYDSDWHDVGGQRLASFYELPPGQYSFKVRAANNDGVWNDAGASMTFTVLPTLWQALWFRVSLGLLLGLAGATAAWLWLRFNLRRTAERLHAAQQIRELAGRLIHAQEAERWRLARELHDDLSQRLALLSMQLELLGRRLPTEPKEALSRMRELSERVRDISTDVHRLSHELHPAKLEQLGLVATARSFCKEIAAARQLSVHFDHEDVPAVVAREAALCLYRILQESLQNVAKHSRATNARVSLTGLNGELRLVVVDDGIGSNFLSGTVRLSAGLGLASMQERVRLVNGRLSVWSSQGKGTRLEATVPVKVDASLPSLNLSTGPSP
jgi:signal transduction histidine kinase/ligand-binding sensor domain-containing protein